MARQANVRGERRREELLGALAEHFLEEGLAGFTLRSAAAAVGTTHKVLLYHFGSAPELVRDVLREVRRRRTEAAAAAGDVRGMWDWLTAEDDAGRLLYHGLGLAMVDPERHGALGRDSIEQYLPAVEAALPADWPPERRTAMATVLLAAIRGLLVDLYSTGDSERVEAGFAAFAELAEGLLGGVRGP